MLAQRLAQGATLVVDSRLAAVQLEAYLARAAGSLVTGVWRSADIQMQDDWCAALWAANFDTDRLILGGSQSEALWRNVVANSASGAALIDTGRIAVWAKEAWSALHSWQLDFGELRARGDDPGFRDFLNWSAQYDATLAQSGWMDQGALATLLADRLRAGDEIPNEVVWADLPFELPAVRNLSDKLKQVGCQTSTWATDSVSRLVQRVGLEDAREELRQAVRWAQQKIDDVATARVALVVPMNGDNELQLARCFDEPVHARSRAYGLADGSALDRQPVIGAALDCLGLFCQRADFQIVSRWLRSPFIGDGLESRSVRCLAEAALRGELVAQLGFVAAYRSAGLDRWLGRRVPLLGACVDRALSRLGRLPRSQSPTRWAGVVQELLSEVGWPGGASSAPGPVLDGWQRALEALSGLTPILGSIDYERALVELRAQISRTRLPGRLPLEGITILSRLEDLGPGYDAAWVMGMSDRLWPRPSAPNPLLPYALQAAQQMPFATPADATERCRALTDRLIARVPELVFSYPLVENDFVAEPSPLLRGIEEIDTRSLPALGSAYAPATQAPLLEHIDDPVPPFSGSAIAGGAGTLAIQAHCPLRAFIDSRLAARPLENLDRGFGPRQRGILVHRALELLFAALPEQKLIAAQREDQLATRIHESIDRAIQERVGGARRALSVYAKLERDRLMPLIRELVSLDLARSDFVTESVETKLTARIAAFDVGCRIDRIDRLADGSLAIIDYKTGSSATPADWFKSRLLEPQLPLYIQSVDAEVEALVIGSVHPGSVAYRGLWQQSDTFPGAPYRPRIRREWPDQKVHWQVQLEELVAEYASGDGRIFVTGLAHAQGAYAPLSRVYEQNVRVASGSNGSGS